MLALQPVSYGILFLLSILSLASQTLAAFPLSNQHAQQNLKARQGTAIASAINGAASAVLQAITLGINIADSIEKQRQDAETQYTQGLVAQLVSQYPQKNVIVYHNQDSQFSGVNVVHMHVEMDLNFLSETQGFEVQVFDSGTFTLEGDGGFANWCFGGNSNRNGDFVQFFPISG